MTTSYTTSDLEAIDAAIQTGHLRVKYADKDVTYRSLDELMQIRAHIAKQLGQTNARSPRYYANTSKGLTSCASEEDE